MAIASTTSCAWFASANAAHTHISGCVDDPTWGAIDVVVGTATGVVFVATGVLDNSVWWALIPATFLTSGIVGSIYATKCKHHENDVSGPPVPITPDPIFVAPPPAPPTPPPPIEPDIAPQPPEPRVHLQLDPDFVARHPQPDAGVDAIPPAAP